VKTEEIHDSGSEIVTVAAQTAGGRRKPSVDTTMADEIAAEIEEQILLGAIPPGTLLRQEQLAVRFGVSRTPIREALRRLDALGLVVLRPNRGVQVRGPSRDELWDSVVVRASLESTAARLAAARISAGELRQLARAERRYRLITERLRDRSLSVPDRRLLAADWVRGNDLFHELILAAADAPLLERMARSVRRVYRTLPVLAFSPEVEEIHRLNLRQHRALVEMMRAGSEGGAEALMREHIMTTGEVLAELFAKMDPTASSGRQRRARRD
jgi:DNA-binding GntR family transcriptional regulator